MIIVYAFYPGDQDLALKNAKWMKHLGTGQRSHEVLALFDKRCVPGIVEEICFDLGTSFDQVHRLQAGAEIDGWPQGANYFFRTATAWLQSRPVKHFMWMEPDAIPLRAGWLDTLESEYEKAGRLFMGDRVQVENIPLHMSGIGVYPNPLHAYAGEAYRAADEAWDMAAKDQIVPKAYFTRLIEHAWKHPKFTSKDELQTQIRPEAILFHSSKDGSLIDLLRGGQPVSRQAHNLETVGSTPTPAIAAPVGTLPTESTATTVPRTRETPSLEEIGDREAQPTCDIFIRTYPKDYPWLGYCLRSIRHFCSGFRKIWIVSPEPPIFDLGIGEWKVMNEEADDHYLSQQIHKLYADVITDYQADYILHVDSDVIFNRPCTPQDFFRAGKPVWYFTPYSQVETPWQPITQLFMNRPVVNEFMRRLPIMIPRWLYPRLREFCHKQHGVIISQYVRNQPQRAFSEFNALGAYAYEFHPEMFHWVNTTVEVLPPPVAKQYFSWGGITNEIRYEIEQPLRGMEDSPAKLSPHLPVTAAPPSVPPQIKELPSGIWVIKDDTHISKWVEQQERLDHDQNSLPFILPLIKEGDSVIDAGAFIGDHSVAYSKAVGETGTVHAYEPNPIAFQCLLHNMKDSRNVIVHEVALANYQGSMALSGNNGNHGGCYAGMDQKLADVRVDSLDNWFYRAHIDFIKLDIEGMELMALQGAEKLIERCRPTMVIEVNTEALRRQRAKPEEIYRWLDEHHYSYTIMQENCDKGDLLYDIVCTPEVNHSGPVGPSPGLEQARAGSAVPISPPPVFDFILAIDLLRKFAAESSTNRQRVIQRLSKAGLKPKKK